MTGSSLDVIICLTNRKNLYHVLPSAAKYAQVVDLQVSESGGSQYPVYSGQGSSSVQKLILLKISGDLSDGVGTGHVLRSQGFASRVVVCIVFDMLWLIYISFASSRSNFIIVRCFGPPATFPQMLSVSNLLSCLWPKREKRTYGYARYLRSLQ